MAALWFAAHGWDAGVSPGVLVFAATFNERENVRRLCEIVLGLDCAPELLIVDDGSPDGTGVILDEIAAGEPRLIVVHRPRKMGLGTAHKIGMLHAIRQGYDVLVTMDADLSHDPRDIPRLLAALHDRDFVIGSRYVVGGSSDLTGYRMAVSRLANVSSRLLLGIPLREFTTSFRAFRAPLLARINVGRIRAQGYSFFLESVFRMHRHGFRMAETPIHFAHRISGESKIPRLEIVNGMTKLLYLFVSRLLNPRPAPAHDPLVDERCYACASPYLVERFPARRVFERGAAAAEAPRIVQCMQCGLSAAGERAAEPQPRPFAAASGEDRWGELLPAPGALLCVGDGAPSLPVAAQLGWRCTAFEPAAFAAWEPREGAFDAVVLIDVLDRAEDPLALLSKARLALRPGGRLLMSAADVEARLPQLLGRNWPRWARGRRFYLSEPVLRDWLALSGFQSIGVSPRRRIVSPAYAVSRLAEALPSWAAGPLRGLGPALPSRPRVSLSVGYDRLFVADRAEDAASA